MKYFQKIFFLQYTLIQKNNSIFFKLYKHFNFIPSAVVKNLGVWFDANFSFADHVRNICKTCLVGFSQVIQYLADKDAFLKTNALLSRRLDYCNFLFRSLSSFNMHKLQCIKTHLVGLTQTAIHTHKHLLFLNNFIGCQLNFTVFTKLPLWLFQFSYVCHCGRYSTRYNLLDS